MEKKKEVFSIASAPSQTTLNMSSTVTLAEKDPDAMYDPFAHRDTDNQYSNMGALAHLLKGSLGSGILAMPMAFMHGGLVFGFIGTFVIGFICTHCVQILVESAQTLCVRLRIPALDMAGTAEKAFSSGPRQLRPYATGAGNFVTTSLFCTYYFGLTAYVVFIAKSVQQLMDQWVGKPDIPEIAYTRVFIALLVVLLIPLSLIRKLKQLVPFSMVANMCIVVGFSITLYYLFDDIRDPVAEKLNFNTSLKGLPLFFATVLFAMEGIGTVMPVENTMRNPKRLIGWNGVLTIAMVVVVTLFALMGLFGYLRYGPLVENGSITLNLPGGEIPAQIVKLLLAVAILFTYPLQMYVAIGIMWAVISPRVRTSWHAFADVAMRVVMVLGTLVLALAVPNLGPIIGLIGALFFSTLGLFIPAVVELATRWEEGRGCSGTNLYLALKNGALILLSIMSIVAGGYSSVLDIIKAYGENTADS
ncbi:proton-coupled amino acid transporter-like protein pathetic isoform X1 [Frankliniella occidentalis]|uniref:Proton-coupled amino acid transporter-like protein pathetic isoform X1 n=2 Tax=Frankliniella occidentalis TaxID=133901 RepID=A0A6J1TE94_FRAOC|nr:proton-coupled amino acid transporter-like protein pathetic isoform X1 [Frankliniella occidentalis]XP_026291062.1 proton-coupled amino acid transporter-like protein pathetic isoform X1 [Frankliniella occidentalis]XP_026291063.1 proton-coupled amino acid transporter-like protein pathetic isoform X1 [Frankliniella occidentalis]XP_052123044.1 proton-coupled amino acid transporter-like protein pathetic isoform X1 [Frankliniella occidentalis]